MEKFCLWNPRVQIFGIRNPGSRFYSLGILIQNPRMSWIHTYFTENTFNRAFQSQLRIRAGDLYGYLKQRAFGYKFCEDPIAFTVLITFVLLFMNHLSDFRMTLKIGFGKCSLFVLWANGWKDQNMASSFSRQRKPYLNMERALLDWPFVLQYDVKAKYRFISRKFSGMKFFQPSVRLANQKPRAFVSVRLTNQFALFPFVCCFCFVRAFSFQGHTKIALVAGYQTRFHGLQGKWIWQVAVLNLSLGTWIRWLI